MTPSKILTARQHTEAGHNTLYLLATTAKNSRQVLYDAMQRSQTHRLNFRTQDKSTLVTHRFLQAK